MSRRYLLELRLDLIDVQLEKLIHRQGLLGRLLLTDLHPLIRFLVLATDRFGQDANVGLHAGEAGPSAELLQNGQIHAVIEEPGCPRVPQTVRGEFRGEIGKLLEEFLEELIQGVNSPRSISHAMDQVIMPTVLIAESLPQAKTKLNPVVIRNRPFSSTIPSTSPIDTPAGKQPSNITGSERLWR